MIRKSYRNVPGVAVAAAVSAILQAQAAYSQEAGKEEAGIAEVTVTGSRISRTDYQSSSPIVTLGSEAITQTNAVNVESALNQLPQFVQGQTQSTVGAVALAGRATLNLRGLGETRNLVLLDGRRLPLSSPFAIVDVNMIPTAILKGVETVSGGASAVYGSEAVSGVVNFLTKDHFDGVQIDTHRGITDQGGAGTFDASITGGFSLAEDRGHVLLNAGYTDRNVLYGKQRDFYQFGVLSSFIGQGTYVPAATNLPTQAAVNTVFAQYGVAPGTVLNSRSLGFNDNGTLFQQIGLTNYSGPSTQLFSTAGNIVRQPVTYQEFVSNPLERKAFFGKFDYDVSENITTYVQFLYNKTTATGQVGFSPTLFVVPVVPVTNPFIPADLRAILASRPNPNAVFTLNDRFMGFEPREFPTDFTTSQTLVGLRGSLPIKDWTWDVYGSFDSTDMVETQDKALLLSRMAALLNAPDGGASICAGGFNPFGLTPSLSVSRACRDYIETETHDYTKTSQSVFEGNLTGSILPLPAGNLKFSLTVSHRRNSYELDPDPAREGADIIGTLQTFPTQGDVSVKEAAVELLVPVLRDKPFAKSFELNVGFRESDYDVTGKAETYKVDGLWKPIEPLMFRAGYERAIRAPNIGELYSAAQAAQAQIGSPPGQGDPCDVRSSARTGASAANIRALCVATGVPNAIADTFQYTTVAIGTLVSGSTALTPEEADTVTVGAVIRPTFSADLASDMSLSVDYYDIDISNVINIVSGVTAMNKCYNLDGTNPTYSISDTYCQLIERDATGGIRTVRTPYLNLGRLHTKGIDAQYDWKFPLTALGLGERSGKLGLNLVASFLQSYDVQLLPGSATQDFSGTIDGTQNGGIPLPDWKSLVSVSYELGGFGANARWRHLPGMDDVTAVTRPASPAAGVPSYDLFDVNLSYRVNEGWLVRGGVTNLLDKEPPVVSGTIGQTQPGTYDIIGRTYHVALQVNF
jgi:outer membrane receptor protein involved in Fe transport